MTLFLERFEEMELDLITYQLIVMMEMLLMKMAVKDDAAKIINKNMFKIKKCITLKIKLR